MGNGSRSFPAFLCCEERDGFGHVGLSSSSDGIICSVQYESKYIRISSAALSSAAETQHTGRDGAVLDDFVIEFILLSCH